MRKLFPSFERNGLIHRWLIVNIFLSSIIVAIQLQEGWVGDLLKADSFYISHGLILAFIASLIISGIKTLRVNNMIKNVDGFIAGHNKKLAEKGKDARGDLRESLKTDLMAYISPIKEISGYLIFAGMLGTVIGLIFATLGIDAQSIADPSAAGIAVAQVLSGFSIALHTTLVGGIAGIWLKANHYMTLLASAHLFSKILRG